MEFLDDIFPSSAGRSGEVSSGPTAPTKPPLMLRLASVATKDFNQEAYQRAYSHLKSNLTDPLPIVKTHATRLTVNIAKVCASTILFSVFAITVIIIAVLVAVNTLSWVSGLILILAFVAIIWLSLTSMAGYLERHFGIATDEFRDQFKTYLDSEVSKFPRIVNESLEKYLDDVSSN
jgi:hypothetical protein